MVKKIVVIFGGNGSLGKKLSNKFYESNCCVVSVDKNNKSFEKIKQNFYAAKADVTNQKSLKNLRSKVIKNFGKVDIIVYSVTYKSKDFYYSFNKFEKPSIPSSNKSDKTAVPT